MKIGKYYNKFDEKPVYVLALILHPYYKLDYIKMAWGGPKEKKKELEAGNLLAKDWHDEALGMCMGLGNPDGLQVRVLCGCGCGLRFVHPHQTHTQPIPNPGPGDTGFDSAVIINQVKYPKYSTPVKL